MTAKRLISRKQLLANKTSFQIIIRNVNKTENRKYISSNKCL